MRIGIDISQMTYEGTGVANYLSNFVQYLLQVDRKNEYILFFSSMRRKFPISNRKATVKAFKFPPVLLDFFWNRLHIFPIEWLIGDVDVFISSDWTQPPTKAKKATILYDLIVYKYPQETDKKIVSVQKRRLQRVKKEADMIFCISEASKRDAMEILNIEEKKLHVLYPGI